MGNLLVIICVLIIAGFTIRGYVRGFLKSALSMAALVLSVVLVGSLSPIVEAGILNYTPLKKVIYTTVYDSVSESMYDMIADEHGKVSKKDNVSKKSVGNSEWEEWLKEQKLDLKEQKQWLKKCHIPEWVFENLEKKSTRSARSLLKGISESIAGTVVHIIAFLGTFMLVYILIQMLFAVCGIINYIPIIGGLNKSLGAVFGAAQGLFCIWIISLIITVLMPSAMGKEIQVMMEESFIISWIYELCMKLSRLGQ